MIATAILRKWWKWIVAALIAACVLAGWNLYAVAVWLESFAEWVAGLGWVGVPVFALFYAVAEIAWAPGTLLTLLAGFLLGLLWGAVAIIVGGAIAAVVVFIAARYLARERLLRKITTQESYTAIDALITRDGWKFTLILRLVPLVPFNFTNIVCGLSGMRISRYMAASIVGMLPGNVLFVYLGAAGKLGLDAIVQHRGLELFTDHPLFVTGLVLTIVMTIGLAWWAATLLKQKKTLIPRA
jgi:uncharacterized membrane protein YdjX (TVP38/TMEM64 family)